LPCTLPTAVATDVKLNPPAADTDPNIARLAGAWEGLWGLSRTKWDVGIAVGAGIHARLEP
jgi:hypothetical protein